MPRSATPSPTNSMTSVVRTKSTSSSSEYVRDVGCGGAIIGRAIYEGQLDLRAAHEIV
jgi:uncharacterized protein related to proFAR isomerase